MAAVRGRDFFYRDRVGSAGEVPLRCRDCGFEFPVPEDWLEAHVGDQIGCPGCSLVSRLPCAEEAEWPYRKDPRDQMSGVGMTDRGGLG